MQPQNSIPDVIIWMMSGKKRVAVSRIPSHEIMYADTAMARGKNCGKVQTITLTVSIKYLLCMRHHGYKIPTELYTELNWYLAGHPDRSACLTSPCSLQV